MAQTKDSRLLRGELEQLLLKLKHNRDKVPLKVLKTKYRNGYQALCKDISQKASDYLKQTVLSGFRVRKEYADEAVSAINKAIADSGLLKQLSKAAFKEQDINKFDALAGQLKDLIENRMEAFFTEHLALYITPECLQGMTDTSEDQPAALPYIYCLVNDCILQDASWVPVESFTASRTKTKETAACEKSA